MPPSGHRHRLVLYTYMLNRWWRAILAIGITLLALAGGLGGLPLVMPQYHFLWVSNLILEIVGGIGGFTILAALFIITIRKSAYVQPYPTYLRLVTPFLRMNIAYRRIVKASSVEMQAMFPPGRITGWQRKLLYPLARQTAIVLEMNGWPLPHAALRLFLSPFFLPGTSPRLALLVPDWIGFSTELENLRNLWRDSLRQSASLPQSDLYRSVIGSNRK